MNTDEIIRQAAAELMEEDFRKAVEAKKRRLRELKALPWWRRLFPFNLKIERIDHV